jgi:hypothetical protein
MGILGICRIPSGEEFPSSLITDGAKNAESPLSVYTISRPPVVTPDEVEDSQLGRPLVIHRKILLL